MTNKARVQVLLLWMCVGLAGCNDPRASSLAAAPSPIPQPVPQPTAIQPTVTAITPNTGSTAGGAWGTITGAQFQARATVRLGIDGVQMAYVKDDATILYWTTSHPAGTVDVVVTNPDGLSSNLAGGYTFAPPESFDFTGDWVAHAAGLGEDEIDMRFTIRDNVLVSLTCGSSEAVSLSPAPSVHNGEFSFLADDGIAIAGRLVSTVNAVGTINVPGCTMTSWWADKSGAIQTAGARLFLVFRRHVRP